MQMLHPVCLTLTERGARGVVARQNLPRMTDHFFPFLSFSPFFVFVLIKNSCNRKRRHARREDYRGLHAAQQEVGTLQEARNGTVSR
mmetsp:Transcript_26748/g.52507  ORF Transcript_26748/g.52507 Transcript_26748/m.52507 type:complete len:87 (-) Transcript_26748:207-467(-)